MHVTAPYQKAALITLLVLMIQAAVATTNATAQYSLPAHDQRPDTVLSGDWRGNVIASNGRRYQLMLHIAAAVQGECAVTYDIVDQQQFGRHMTSASCDNGRLLFINDSLLASFEGAVVGTDGVIDGVWTQDRTRVAVRLYKVRPIIRSQEPTADVPYVSRQVMIPNRTGGVQLGGTLVLPDEVGSWPLLIFVSDRGQQNRDALDATGHRPFLVLADQFVRQQFASLRLDDRGTGLSTDVSSVSLADGVSDLVSAIDRMQGEANISPANIILIGHGEGGLIAAEAARMRSNTVRGVVFAATPALDGRNWLIGHARAADELHGIDPDVTAAAVQLLSVWYDAAASGADKADVAREILDRTDSMLARHGELLAVYPAATRLTRPDRNAYVSEQILPWLESFRVSNAPERLKAIAVPGLVLIAEKDAVVPARPNAEAWRIAASGNKKITIETIQGVNHGFQPCEMCTAEEAEYSELTIDTGVIDRIAAWASRLLRR